ncbi:GntR family transcriptional regulator [Streptomyces fuscigenes]|uniref:GntR family transcriptional regulator n=1 Tax=Streptomyces fuscigenes TaxID=1528880 RepID=UPI001F3A1842|nr:GntR family transcriptional regulator [Streptomyces fuscigenes]MCF3964669.1 GntR family transcriptional regulator [Streptomyces fuscigenes]
MKRTARHIAHTARRKAGTVTVPGISGREKAYAYLRDTVIADPAMLGRFVNEQAVADSIGVSRTPIREALLLLAAEDLVQLIPKKGAYVAPLSGREVSELMDLRSVLESHAARVVLAQDRAPVAEMRRLVEEQARVSGPGQAARFIELDHHFHMALVRTAGNSILTRTYEGLRARQVRCGITAVFRSSGRQDSVMKEHRAIADALEAGAADAVADAIQTHLDATRSALLASGAAGAEPFGFGPAAGGPPV